MGERNVPGESAGSGGTAEVSAQRCQRRGSPAANGRAERWPSGECFIDLACRGRKLMKKSSGKNDKQEGFLMERLDSNDKEATVLY